MNSKSERDSGYFVADKVYSESKRTQKLTDWQVQYFQTLSQFSHQECQPGDMIKIMVRKFKILWGGGDESEMLCLGSF